MKFRDLKASEVDARIGQVGNGYFTLLLYKDARVDMALLDEVVGADKWQREHYSVKDNLFCRVGILTESGWVWKADCGTESKTEGEKGEASDSFKRACVNWGIGRELYTAPKIFINSDSCKKGSVPEVKNFTVDSMTVTDKEITQLQISGYNTTTKKREIVFEHGKKTKDILPPQGNPAPPIQPKTRTQLIKELIKGTHIEAKEIGENLQAEYNVKKVDALTPEQWEAFYKETKEAVNNFEDKLN